MFDAIKTKCTKCTKCTFNKKHKLKLIRFFLDSFFAAETCANFILYFWDVFLRTFTEYYENFPAVFLCYAVGKLLSFGFTSVFINGTYFVWLFDFRY